jgi:gliding motility-associated-like protein
MKLKLLILFLISTGFMSIGLSQIMTVGNRSIGCSPDTFRFYTLGNTHSGQVWSSGNGNNSSIDTPVFLYNIPGTYSIKIGSLTKTITILPSLNLNFTTDSVKFGCFPFKFNLRDITSYPVGITPTQINWVYQSGGTKIGTNIQDFITNYYLYNCFVKMIVTTNVPSCTGEVKKDSFFKILDIPKAKIDITPDSSCRVPFSPTLNNKSRDSLKTVLTYLWKWNVPPASFSTNFIPPTQTYTTNASVLYTLETINKFGCKGYDTVRFKVETPTVNFTMSTKICSKEYGFIKIANYDTANFTYKVVSDKRTNGQDIIYLYRPSPPVIPPDVPYDSICGIKGYDGDFPNANVIRKLTVIKTSKRDSTCKVSITKSILICQTFPRFKINMSKVCGFPFQDSITVINTLGNSACWDSIVYTMSYVDKYGVNITKDSFNATKPYVITRSINDSMLLYGLDSVRKVDSFYRKGPFKFGLSVGFFSNSSSMMCTHTTDGGTAVQSSILRPHLVDYFNKGCLSTRDSFRVYNYGNGKIVNVKWHFGDGTTLFTTDSMAIHVYPIVGYYRAYAVVTNSNGCIDTTNPVFIKRGDSIIPKLSISKRNFCITDSTVLTINNSSNYSQWKFLTDNYKPLDCPNSLTATYNKFYNAGKQYVYIIAEKDGCITKVKDSIYVDGPRFILNYDFKCSRRDNIKFFLSDTIGIRATSFDWDFGDMNTLSSGLDTQWHTYTGTNSDHWVKVSIQNPSGCKYEDSTLVKIRKVKALFTDTLFCKKTYPGTFLNSTPYALNPLQSQNADYLCYYNYTWLMESIPSGTNPIIKFPPISFNSSVNVNFPLDTINLSLIARDVNGCADTMKRPIYLSNNHIDFKLKYDSCPPMQTIQCINFSTSPWGISKYNWIIRKIKKGVDTFVVDSSSIKNPSFTVDTFMSDSFKITLKITDSANCLVKELTKLFIFVKDTSHLIIPDSICHYSKPLIYSSENNSTNYKYVWKVNERLIASDTTYRLNYQFDTLGYHQIRLEKTHRFKGCTNIFIDTVLVKPKPRIRIDNSFDLATNKCFPAITTIDFFDSLNIPNLYHKFVHNNSLRTLKPTTIALDGGINAIYSIFTTAYGCYDSFVNYDTVYKPSADLVLSKKMICKNDSIEFKLINLKDVDSILWSFGDGTLNSGIQQSIYHKYTSVNILSDSILVSFIVYAPRKACPNSKSDTIIVLEALSSHYLNNKTDTAYCLAPVVIHNTAKRSDSIRWDFGNGKMDTISKTNFSYNYTQAGSYRIKQYAYRKPLGCVDSSVSNLILYPIPKIIAQVDSVCLGYKLDIQYQTVLSNIKVYLYPDSFQKSPYTQSPISTQISKTTQFKLVNVSDKGCIDSTQLTSVAILPHYEKSWDTIVAMGSVINIPVGYNPYWTYTWSPKLINPSCSLCPTPELQIFDSATYSLTIKDYRNCFNFSYKYIIRLYPDILVKVPTAFTPNGDGNNDIVYARGFGIKKLKSFKIFNRLGQLLFLTTNETIGWDGYYKNVLQNTDSYFYTYEAESFIPGKVISGEGNFMLLR